MQDHTGTGLRLAVAAFVFCSLPATSSKAAEPASILPDGVFATGDGCTMLSQAAGADNIDATDFFVLTNGELTGMDLACRFTDAESGAGDQPKSWTVKATCESGAPAVPAVIKIEEAGSLYHVTMTSEGDVEIAPVFAESPINLHVTIAPQPSAPRQLRDLLEQVAQLPRRDDGVYDFRVIGTVGAPHTVAQ